MANLLAHFIPRLKRHLTDEELANASSESLSRWDYFLVKLHLAQCQLCRVREENLERRADRLFADLQRHMERQGPNPPRADIQAFQKRRNEFLATYVPQKRWSFRLPMMTWLELPTLTPALATGVVFAVGALVSFFVWNQQRVPTITSASFLNLAEHAETARVQNTSGVVYQSVKISTGQRSVQRAIYRDPQGKRRMKAVKFNANEAQMEASLGEAGVDWNEPLSAVSYQKWHDEQSGRKDEVRRVGRNLLKLTTAAPQGAVEEQSLTVREADFHPVKRTIEFRDHETVEIAELDFKILPWSTVDAGIFESLSASTTVVASDSPARVIPFPLSPIVTAEQLDEAELSARLALMQLHADSGERIQLQRDAQSIVVKGIVDTDQRKEELQAQLRVLPHVQPSIQSIEDLQQHPDTSVPDAVDTQVISRTVVSSPLANYLVAQGRGTANIAELSHDLVNAASTVEAESRTLSDLVSRFGAEQGRASDLAQAALSELVFSHRERLIAALKEEEQLLARTGVPSAANTEPSLVATTTLAAAADRNLALCKELAVGGEVSRDATLIVSDVRVSVQDVRARLQQTRLTASNTNAASSGKK